MNSKKPVIKSRKESKRIVTALPVKTAKSVFDEVQQMNDRIMKRAFEIFEGRGQFLGMDLDDWLQAERELGCRPSIELQEKGGNFLLQVALPGAESKDIDIQVQMFSHLKLNKPERARVAEILFGYLEDQSRIVKTFALQGLADLARRDPAFRDTVRPVLEQALRAGSPAMRSRARKILDTGEWLPPGGFAS